jgi:hypothetical protein
MIATSSSAAVASGAAVGSKAARACDGCLRRRARWYCAADDAFLCQSCDTSVHSANPLARRHEHLRLHPSSSPPAAGGAAANKQRERNRDEVVPAWFGRKARTQRGGHASAAKRVVRRELSRRLSVVPEAAGSGGNWPEEGRSCAGEADADEEQLLYRVPVFDPALGEFCSPPPPLEDKTTTAAASSTYCNEDVGDMNATKPYGGHASFEPMDAELREFAAGMEALLGRGLDDGNDEDSSFYMETLGMLDPVAVDDGARVKVEAENGGAFDATDAPSCCPEVDPAEASDEMLDIDFDYGSPQETAPDENTASSNGTVTDGKLLQLQRSLSLTLNYEAIIQSLGTSPFTGGGDRPHVKLDDCWPHDYSVRVPFTQSQTRPHVRNTRVTYTIFCMHRLSLSCVLNHSN